MSDWKPSYDMTWPEYLEFDSKLEEVMEQTANEVYNIREDIHEAPINNFEDKKPAAKLDNDSSDDDSMVLTGLYLLEDKSKAVKPKGTKRTWKHYKPKAAVPLKKTQKERWQEVQNKKMKKERKQVARDMNKDKKAGKIMPLTKYYSKKK